MRDNQELLVIKIDLVSGILQIDSQITFTGLKRQVLHLLPFFSPRPHAPQIEKATDIRAPSL